ncbi:uncharacterized protein LOC130623728 isoform X2 [Hydractinia symbiolongicarpus]|uniref:uncharacterized protein LOC130623728 isoform X2 n=1 Tax=Hydractinia symbiolongicarpus TaxID=13093 RepID=UPI00254AD8DA|nr:uncharacterized protein LOC130623728 isoform X2 [Hydractinia symbiolongicarpus]
MASLNALVEAAKLVEYEKDGTPTSSKSSKLILNKFCLDDVDSHQKNSISVANTIYKSRWELQEDLASRKGRPGGGTRETHNKLEKNRRAELKNFFQKLKQSVPKLGDKPKASNVSILTEARRYIEELKTMEKEYEVERTRLHKCRLCYEERIKLLKEDMHRQNLQNQLFVQVQQEKKRSESPVPAKKMKTVEVQANEQDIKAAIPDAGEFHEKRDQFGKEVRDFSGNYNAPLYEKAVNFNHETKHIMGNLPSDCKEFQTTGEKRSEKSDELPPPDTKKLKKELKTFIEDYDSEDELKLVVDDNQ